MKKDKNYFKKIALERIEQLFKEAKKNPEKANRYVELARKIAMKTNSGIPRKYKRRFCKHCYNYFKGDNYRVRTRNKMVVYYCKNCKRYMRFKI